MASTPELTWYEDGHYIQLRLDRTEVVVAGVVCPNKGNCKHPEVACVVDYFLRIYGLECNVGSCELAPNIEIAWAISDGHKELDATQVWVIPVDDVTYSAWTSYQKSF